MPLAVHRDRLRSANLCHPRRVYQIAGAHGTTAKDQVNGRRGSELDLAELARNLVGRVESARVICNERALRTEAQLVDLLEYLTTLRDKRGAGL